MKKIVFVIGAAGLVVLLVVELGLLRVANGLRPTLEDAMGKALGRKVSIGTVGIAPLSGGITVGGLAIADDADFGAMPFLTAKAATVGVDLRRLIFSRRVRVESLRLEEPQVVLVRSVSGSWNISGVGAVPSSGTSGAAPSVSIAISKVAIARGRVIVGSATERRTYDDVNLEATNLSFVSQFPFRMTAKTPGGGTIDLDGQAGPFDVHDVAKTPFRADVHLKHVDASSSGFIAPASGMNALIDFSGALVSDGRVMTSQGRINAARLQILPGRPAAPVPIVIDYDSDYHTDTHHGVIKQGSVHVGKAVVRLIGDFDVGGVAPAVRMALSGSNMPVPELEAILPAVGVTLPPGASLRQGTLDADLTIIGPIDFVVVAGSIGLSNATITGFDLGARLGTMASFAGLQKSRDTTIRTLGATIRVTPDVIRVDSLHLAIPSIGSLSGAGAIAPSGGMDFRMLAKPSGARVITGGVFVASLGNGIPVRIQGTTSNPTFGPDVNRAVINVVKSPKTATKAAGGALSGLFGRKRQ